MTRALVLFAAKPGETLACDCTSWREVRAQVRAFEPTAWAVRPQHRPAGYHRRLTRLWGGKGAARRGGLR